MLHLPKLNSDHRPILVRSTDLSSRVLSSRPFRLQAAWLTNEGFNDFVFESWDRNLYYLDATNQFRLKVTEWNKRCFGNIFWQKKCLLARLGGIQRALESYYSKGLLNLEKQLKADMEEVLTQEEIIWHQKSRRDWLLLGDRNTSYLSLIHI